MDPEVEARVESLERRVAFYESEIERVSAKVDHLIEAKKAIIGALMEIVAAKAQG